MLSEAKTTDYTKLLSTEAGLRAVTRWFLQRDIFTQHKMRKVYNNVTSSPILAEDRCVGAWST